MSLFTSRLCDAFRHTGLAPHDTAPLAAACLLASQYAVDPADSLGKIFAAVARELRCAPHHDGITAARDWLESPTIPGVIEKSISTWSLPLIGEAATAVIDWDAEANALLDVLSARGPASMDMAVADALTELMPLAPDGSCTCAFGASATIAWSLSRHRPVTWFVSEPELVTLFSLLAVAAKRSLTIDRRNPLDGTFGPVQGEDIRADRSSPISAVDYIITAPPIGMRLSGSDKGTMLEGRQVALLSPLAKRAFITLLPDGTLFREGRADVSLRQTLLETRSVAVTSLPSGIWGRWSSVSTSLVTITPEPTDTAWFIDGRTMATQSVGRVQSRLLAQHLSGLSKGGENAPRQARVPIEEIAAQNFVLTPDRYLRSHKDDVIAAALARSETILLEKVAVIERSKAPRPLLDDAEPAALTCREIAPADIQDGAVRMPKRVVRFSEAESKRARNVSVAPGDILVSIKGNVGVVGRVPDLDVIASEVFDEPWIVAQSLAIVRWQPNTAIPSPDILALLMTAPWVRTQLERLSGGTAINTLPISALRGLELPVPDSEQCAAATREARIIADLEEQAAQLREEINASRNTLWQKLWQLEPESHEE
ncbi:N-6 DNA Methylase [Sphingomonas sp. OV641]|uniref:N-6 DNA methylase n=1 Tax=Sphingomonas sp. OV641 TaxID=1881068 RepID=UPI0008B0D698|nr:N-6 DNA methylase [Sphingomonas sp. OV641]SEK02007.1 N-6 DNA Methylase [Sphingomonas sp. OV641]